MNHRVRPILTGCLLIAALCGVAAVDEPSREQLERNRRYLEKLARDDPSQFQLLQRYASTFASLPADRRKQLLKLEQDLAQAPVSTQGRLQAVAIRYSEWLDTLSDADRDRLKKASSREAKLQIIRELREAEWLKSQPIALREKIATLKGAERTAAIAQSRKVERDRRLQWVFAARFWDELQTKKPLPAKLSDFGVGVENFVNDYLFPRLTNDEKDRLDKAQGRWPDYPVALVEIADRHPPALPGVKGPKSFEELPGDVRKLVAKGKKAKGVGPPGALFKAQGAWPQFGQAVADYAKKATMTLPNEFLAHNYQSLTPPMQEFHDKILWPRLSEDEKKRVNTATNQWPDYPSAIESVARAHNLQPPWHVLPGGWEAWKKYRLKSAGE